MTLDILLEFKDRYISWEGVLLLEAYSHLQFLSNVLLIRWRCHVHLRNQILMTEDLWDIHLLIHHIDVLELCQILKGLAFFLVRLKGHMIQLHCDNNTKFSFI